MTRVPATNASFRQYNAGSQLGGIRWTTADNKDVALIALGNGNPSGIGMHNFTTGQSLWNIELQNTTSGAHFWCDSVHDQCTLGFPRIDGTKRYVYFTKTGMTSFEQDVQGNWTKLWDR